MTTTAALAAAALAGAAAALLTPGSPAARSRLHRMAPPGLPQRRGAPGGPPPGPPQAPRPAGLSRVSGPPRVSGPSRSAGSGRAGPRLAACAGVALAAAVFLSGPLSGPVAALLGVPAALVAHRVLSRQEPVGRRRARAQEVAAVPLVADLLAAAIQAGSPAGAAVDAVARAVGGPVGQRLQAVGAAVALARDPAEGWRRGTESTPLAGVGSCLARSQSGGGACADALRALADGAREEARWAVQERARSVGTRAAAPLGLCFLPAFVLVGVIPLVAGAALTVLP